MKNYLYIVFLLFSCLLKSQNILCNDENTLLFDNTKVLKSVEKKILNQRLNKLRDSLFIKVYFVFVDTLNGNEKEIYVKKLIEEWNILQVPSTKEMLVFSSIKDKKIMIEVSQAISKNFSETAALDIMNNLLSPGIEKKEYYKAVNKSIDEILKYLGGYYEGPAFSPNYDHDLDKKWYMIKSYDHIGLIIMIILALLYNIFVYVKFVKKPLGIYLLYQTLWHLLGTLNLFLYTVLIFRYIDKGIEVYIFNIVIGVLHIVILLRHDDIFKNERYIRQWTTLFIVSLLLTTLFIIFKSQKPIDSFQTFLPCFYYGFFFNMILYILTLIIASYRRAG